MKELSMVEVTVDVPRHGLAAGALGTIVYVHEGGAAYEVEFARPDGASVVTLEAGLLRPVSRREARRRLANAV
jgi:hypothetical protein